ncbi:MAG: dihydroorotase [Filimonas sp.]|nr:dihydroorotase [Filimonas sp.]
MKILLQQALVADLQSPHNNSTKDILIENGQITSIADKIDAKDATVIAEKGLVVSPGWVDSFAHFGDPGLEYRETIESGSAAATAGGYTHVLVLPNTAPVTSNKTQVEYIVQKGTATTTTVLPLGSVTKNIEGKDLAEMYDMQNSGAIAFTDGIYPVQSPGLLLKALQYVKAFDGVIVQVPVDDSLGKHGLMHEGIVSTRLGLPGIPSLAEELIVKRDIELLRYTESKLHFSGISTAKGLELIKAAKLDGLQVTCSVTPFHLTFCDEDLQSYDTNLKVTPVLRSRQDMLALREGVLNGDVDCIASHHIPHNQDNKVCEFEYAKPGMIGLQTAYAVVQTAIPSLPADKVAALFSTNVRRIFDLQTSSVTEGSVADLTFFLPAEKSVLTRANNRSKSINSPFFDKPLTGKVAGTVHKGNVNQLN